MKNKIIQVLHAHQIPLTSKDIAQELGVSMRTVQRYLHNPEFIVVARGVYTLASSSVACLSSSSVASKTAITEAVQEGQKPDTTAILSLIQRLQQDIAREFAQVRKEIKAGQQATHICHACRIAPSSDRHKKEIQKEKIPQTPIKEKNKEKKDIYTYISKKKKNPHSFCHTQEWQEIEQNKALYIKWHPRYSEMYGGASLRIVKATSLEQMRQTRQEFGNMMENYAYNPQLQDWIVHVFQKMMRLYVVPKSVNKREYMAHLLEIVQQYPVIVCVMAIEEHNYQRNEKEVIGNVRSVSLTADGKAFLVQSQGRYGIIQPKPAQKIKEPIPTGGLVMNLVPREEWRQIFNDTWRRHRDFFYDPNMQGVDWDEMKKRRMLMDELGGTALLVLSSTDESYAFVYDRSVDGEALEFEFKDEVLTDTKTGSQWDHLGRCTSGAMSGKQLQHLQCYQQYVRAWSSFHGHTDFYDFNS